jgi:hypothetical protein
MALVDGAIGANALVCYVDEVEAIEYKMVRTIRILVRTLR